MKVKELIKELKKCNPNALVIMSSDREGNNHSPLDEIAHGNVNYRAESTWYGEVGFKKLTKTLIKEGYSEEDCIEDGEDAVVLLPTN